MTLILRYSKIHRKKKSRAHFLFLFWLFLKPFNPIHEMSIPVSRDITLTYVYLQQFLLEFTNPDLIKNGKALRSAEKETLQIIWLSWQWSWQWRRLYILSALKCWHLSGKRNGSSLLRFIFIFFLSTSGWNDTLADACANLYGQSRRSLRCTWSCVVKVLW